MMRPEYDRLLTPAFRVSVDCQTDPDLLEEQLHALRRSLRAAKGTFERQVLVTKMQLAEVLTKGLQAAGYETDRLATLAAEEQENDG